MSLTHPGSPCNGVAQNGHAALKPWQPCGMGMDDEYLTVISDDICPQGAKQCVGVSEST